MLDSFVGLESSSLLLVSNIFESSFLGLALAIVADVVVAVACVAAITTDDEDDIDDETTLDEFERLDAFFRRFFC